MMMFPNRFPGTPRSRTALAAVLLTLLPAGSRAANQAPQAPTEAAGWTSAQMVLQTNDNHLDPTQLCFLLQSDTFLSSVVPKLVYHADLAQLPTVMTLQSAHEETVRAGRASRGPKLRDGWLHAFSGRLGNLCGITIVSRDGRAAEAALESIAARLAQFRSTTADEHLIFQARLEEREAQAQKSYQEIVITLKGITEEASGLDPESWLKTQRGNLHAFTEHRFELRARVAVQQALREHLAERLASTPETIERPGQKVMNPAMLELERELEMAQTDLRALRASMDATQRGVQAVAPRLEALSQRITAIEHKIALVPRLVDGPLERVINLDHQNNQSLLLDSEFALSKLAAELAALEEQTGQLQDDVRRFYALTHRYDEARMQRASLHDEIEALRAELADAARMALRFERPAVTVFSGPNQRELE